MKTAFASFLLAVFILSAETYSISIEEHSIEKKQTDGQTTLISSLISCDNCKELLDGLSQILQEMNTTDEGVLEIFIQLCGILQIHKRKLCESYGASFKDEFFEIHNRTTLKLSVLCYFVIGYECGDPPYNDDWTVPLPNVSKPAVTELKPPTTISAPKNRILHLSDIHYDKEYTPGLSNDCGEPLCCRPPNEEGTGETAAGYWGDYNCDVPLWTIENLLQMLARKSDEFDWVYWTGDIPPHDNWKRSRADRIYALRTVSDLIKKYLPDKPVFPSIGNHEMAPINNFPPSYISGPNSDKWLLDAVATAWSDWLPAAALETLRKDGYYSVEIRRGLRVISLQTNQCYRFNWWLFVNAVDPGNQLRWLIEQLQSAEDAGEKIHIIGHIPPGDQDCIKAWKYNFNKIVNRYESTIVGQFYGHTHYDTFQIYYDEIDTNRPVSVSMISPSVTPYVNTNMCYRIYVIDGGHIDSTNALLNFEAYYMNVSDARVTNESNWLLEYKASEDYGMEHAFPSDFDDLVKRFEQDDALFQSYYRHITGLYPQSQYCNTNCKESTICVIKATTSSLCT